MLFLAVVFRSHTRIRSSETIKPNATIRRNQMLKLIAAVAFVSLCSTLTVGAQKSVVRPPGAEPSASWSHGILVGDTLFISGMGGEDAAGKIPGGFEAEVKQALAKKGAVLKAGGMSPGDVGFW